jgi:hypothetical protein
VITCVDDPTADAFRATNLGTGPYLKGDTIEGDEGPRGTGGMGIVTVVRTRS